MIHLFWAFRLRLVEGLPHGTRSTIGPNQRVGVSG